MLQRLSASFFACRKQSKIMALDQTLHISTKKDNFFKTLSVKYLLCCPLEVSASHEIVSVICFVLFDLILNVPSTIFQLYRDMSSWVEPELS